VLARWRNLPGLFVDVPGLVPMAAPVFAGVAGEVMKFTPFR
jgi:hypothetical protein